MDSFYFTGDASASTENLEKFRRKVKELADLHDVKLSLHASKRLWLNEDDDETPCVPLANDELTDGPVPE